MIEEPTIEEPMLEVSGLRCERGERLLFDHLAFTVAPGELLRVEGANGAGKSTLLRILAGLYADFEGEVHWNCDRYPIYLGHKPGVKDRQTVLENLNWLCRLQGDSPDAAKIDDALRMVGLAGYGMEICGNLSEGQRKRVSLARLFLVEHPVWLLDEPFSAIDPDGVRVLESRIEAQLAEGGLVLLTSHQPMQLESRSVVLG